jgi:hypothetical protein
LEEPICLDKRFDLAVSLEVAEHLTPERAATFIDDICQASDVDSWYIQNTFLFVKIGDPRRALFSNNPLLDVHHPRLLLKPIQLAKYGIFVPSPNT